MHYAIMVIGEDPESIIAPYGHENEEYFEDVDTTANVKREIENFMVEKNIDMEAAAKQYGVELVYSEEEFSTNTDYQCALVKNDKIAKSKERYNPSAHWDWYEIGGRWSGFFITKKGKSVDSSIVGDIDWVATSKQHNDGLAVAAIVDEFNGWIDSDLSFMEKDHDGKRKQWLVKTTKIISNIRQASRITIIDCHN